MCLLIHPSLSQTCTVKLYVPDGTVGVPEMVVEGVPVAAIVNPAGRLPEIMLQLYPASVPPLAVIVDE